MDFKAAYQLATKLNPWLNIRPHTTDLKQIALDAQSIQMCHGYRVKRLIFSPDAYDTVIHDLMIQSLPPTIGSPAFTLPGYGVIHLGFDPDLNEIFRCTSTEVPPHYCLVTDAPVPTGIDPARPFQRISVTPHSPEATLSYREAFDAVLKGSFVRRTSWPEGKMLFGLTFIGFNYPFFFTGKPLQEMTPYNPMDLQSSDWQANDWVILLEPKGSPS